MPTAVIIGAGPGLGLSMARRLGREGHKIALISRNPDRHTGYLHDLAAGGIQAASFGADVRDPDGLGKALDQVVERFGDIDIVYYGPSPHNVAESQKSIEEISSADVKDAMSVVYPATDVVAKVLPSMLERKTGALLFTSAISAVLPIPALGAMTVPAAAARSYALTLNAALARHNIYAGVLVIGGLIKGSDIHGVMAANPEQVGTTDPSLLLDPDRIADIAWDLVTKRKTAEALVTPGRKSLGITMLLVSHLLRVRKRSARPRRPRA